MTPEDDYAPNRFNSTCFRSPVIRSPTVLPTNAAVEKTLQSMEQTGWQAWKDHDAKPVEGMTPDNVISIADGMVAKGKQQVLKSMTDSGCDGQKLLAVRFFLSLAR